MENLTLNVKKKWFDMILSGVKKEEYREIKQFWFNRLKAEVGFDAANNQKEHYWFHEDLMFDTITFLNGMKPLTPTIVIECKGIEIGKAVPEWSDNWKGEVFIIKLGNIISTKNL